ncbi:MAG: hypothetical protein KDB14_12610 [Planctomycetales bacterium]|nr:hypothetical protein [Planctomycetales bacterium]
MCVLFLILAPLVGQTDLAPRGETTAAEIRALVTQLSSDRFLDRERAAHALWSAGQAAIEPLQLLVRRGGDREAVARAEELLELLRYGVTPDTPPELRQQVEQFRKGNRAVRQQVLQEVHDRGDLELMVRLIGSVQPEAEQDAVLQAAEPLLVGAVRREMFQGNWGRAESLLETVSRTERGRRHWLAFHLARGTLPAQLQTWLAKPADTPGRAVTLSLLQRANGNLEESLKWAKLANDPFLVDSLLIELERWEELSDRGEITVAPSALSTTEQFGFMSLIHQWAGRPERQREVVEKALAMAKGTNGNEQFAAIEVVLVNERQQEGLALLKANSALKAFFLYSNRSQYAEALELAEVAEPTEQACAARLRRTVEAIREGGKDRTDLAMAIELALLADSLGWKKLSDETFDSLGEVAKDASLRYTVLSGMVRSGRRAMAFRHAESTRFRTTLFGDRSTEATIWMEVLRGLDPEAPLEQIWQRIDDALEGRGEAPEWLDWESLERTARGRPAGDLWWTMALAAAARADTARADRYFRGATDKNYLAAWRDYGDFLREQKQCAAAAEAYARSAKNKLSAADTYLAGACWKRAGEVKRGEELCELGLLLPLGEGHREMGAELSDREETEGALEAWRRDLRTLAPRDTDHFNAALQLGDALAEQDAATSARMWRRQLLNIMKGGVTFTSTVSYLRLPCMILRQDARVAVARGDLEQAKRCLARCAALMPHRITVPEELVPELRRAGHAELSDWLYEVYREQMQQAVDKYPHCALLLNNFAWMAARCHRDLEAAKGHSQRAVSLEPDSATYLDTLAEIEYRLGSRDEALRLMRKCLELDPKEPHFRRQLQRFEANRKADE